MARFRSNGRGSTGIVVKYRGVPLIRRLTGTNDEATLRALETMLDALYATGQLSLLDAIARGRLPMLRVYDRWKHNQPLPSVEVFPFLGPAWDEWLGALKASEGHKAGLRWTRKALRIPADATIAELPALLMDLRKRCVDKAPAFNHHRVHTQAFARDALQSVSHPLYQRLRDVRPYPKGERQRGQPHTVELIRAISRKLSELSGDPRVGLMCWTMAAYGMGNKEYWTDGYQELADRVSIYGAKRQSRTREVPRWTRLGPPVISEKAFRALLKLASGGVVGVYDLRRSYSRWMEEAGIIETNRAAYLGHGVKTITMLYAWGELPGQLTSDGVLMRVYAGEDSPVAFMEVGA